MVEEVVVSTHAAAVEQNVTLMRELAVMATFNIQQIILKFSGFIGSKDNMSAIARERIGCKIELNAVGHSAGQ